MAKASDGFAAKIRFLRKSRGMSVRELEDVVGIGHSAIARWEHGSPPACSLETLELIAKFFGVPISYLLDSSADVDRMLNSSTVIRDMMTRLAKVEEICGQSVHYGHREEGNGNENHLAD